MGETLKLTAFADLVGLDPRSIRDMITIRGLPAVKRGRSWVLDVATAKRWLADHSRRWANRQKRAKTPVKPPRRRAPKLRKTPLPQDLAGVEERQAQVGKALRQYLDLVLDGGTAADVTSLKQLSSELRLLELHRLELQKALPREEHQRIVRGIGQLVIEEIQAATARDADEVMRVLADAEITFIDAPRVRRLIVAQLGAAAEVLRARIASKIEAAAEEGT